MTVFKCLRKQYETGKWKILYFHRVGHVSGCWLNISGLSSYYCSQNHFAIFAEMLHRL